MSGSSTDPAPAPGPEEPVQHEWDLFGEGSAEEIEHHDPEGWGGPREDRAQHLGRLADTWLDAMPEEGMPGTAPEHPDDVQDLLQEYCVKAMECPELESRKPIWLLNNREDEMWMELQAEELVRQRSMGNWKNVLEGDLNCNHASIQQFRKLLDLGHEGYMEATRVLHHIFKDRQRAPGMMNFSDDFSGLLKTNCAEAMETLSANWALLQQPTKGKGKFAGVPAPGPGFYQMPAQPPAPDKGKGKGKNAGQGKGKGKNEDQGKGKNTGWASLTDPVNPWCRYTGPKWDLQEGPR